MYKLLSKPINYISLFLIFKRELLNYSFFCAANQVPLLIFMFDTIKVHLSTIFYTNKAQVHQTYH